MAGKIDITASVLIALASFAAGQAMAANNTSDTARGLGSINENTRSMAAGTMLDGRATLRPAGQPELLLAQAQEPPAAGQPDPELLLKKKHEAEGAKPEPAKPHEEKPAPEAHKPPPEAKEPPPEAKEPPAPRAPEPPKPEAQKPEPKPEPQKPELKHVEPQPEPKHVEPPPPRAEPAPEPKKSEPQKPKAHEAAPAEMAPAAPAEGKHRAPEAEKPPAEPKPKQEKPAEPPMPAAPKPPVKAAEPPAAQPAPEQAPESVKPQHKPKDPQPPKAEQAPAPADVAPPAEKPTEKPVLKPKPPAAPPQQEAPPAKPEEKPAAPSGEKPPVVSAPTEPTKTQPAPAEQPSAPNKAAPPPVAAPTGEAPVKQRPAKPDQPQAPAGQAPAPAAAPGTPPPVPPAPAPGDAAKGNPPPAAILPPLNTVQSRDQNQPAQGGQGDQAGQGGKPGRPGQPAQPGQVPEAARPQFSQEQQQPFTPKELQRLKALAARPDQSNDTIVLPVDNGAPVLDSDKDANWRRGMTEDQLRRMRKQSAQEWNYAVPTSDEQAQQEYYGNRKRPPIEMESIEQYQGRRLQRAPQFLYPEDVRVGQEFDDDRRVMDYDGQIVVRGDDNRRFEQYGRPVIYEQVDHQRIRETVFKRNGDRIVTLRNRYGQLIQRSRVDADGREVVLFYSPALYEADDSRQVIYRDPGASLPPMRLRVPLNDYIVDVGSQPNRDYYDFIEQPPVEPVERVYTIDEVRNSARIRDKMRRIDLDTITFATGSWDISLNQAGTLKNVADAMAKVLRNNPAETFLIEGHTDAVGSAESNLVLSDRRAQAVADVLTKVYGIAPENMVTQGYGEQFLKVMTYGPEQQNRRVTIRRVTPLVRPVQ